ncbi:hypothetical protein D3C83_223490 [compost metagenome]
MGRYTAASFAKTVPIQSAKKDIVAEYARACREPAFINRPIVQDRDSSDWWNF